MELDTTKTLNVQCYLDLWLFDMKMCMTHHHITPSVVFMPNTKPFCQIDMAAILLWPQYGNCHHFMKSTTEFKNHHLPDYPRENSVFRWLNSCHTNMDWWNRSLLFQVLAWWQTGYKPLSIPMLACRHMESNFSEIWIKIGIFSLTEMKLNWKYLFARWLPFSFGLLIKSGLINQPLSLLSFTHCS